LVSDALACPLCGERLARDGAAVRCPQQHSFDVARQGYVNLLSSDGKAPGGDSAAMVAARADFLEAGHFDPIAAALSEAAPDGATAIIDVGAGTGWYLASLLDARPDSHGLALDASKYAARRAARAHARAAAVVCDTWASLPLLDGSADLVVDVFAPRNGAEMARVLAPGGTLLVVTPDERHLGELAGPLGLLSVDPLKWDRLEAELSPHLAYESRDTVSFGLTLDRRAIEALVAMGPSARHVETRVLAERVAALPDPTRATASVVISRWRA
jgi:23S rRNA (guanine745-N1)-methyltransferase